LAKAPEFRKRRLLLHPGAWRLLREKACADYAQQVVPAQVRGMQLLFPKTAVHLGLYVTVQTEAIPGEALLPLLYQPETLEVALDLGLVVLEALVTADVVRLRGSLFGVVYRYGKGAIAALQTLAGAPPLPPRERRTLLRLLRTYWGAGPERRVLVHGDLHASHILVDRQAHTLGLIDLEVMHVGNPATNFAQLWTAYHYADPALGRLFYARYMARFPEFATARFDAHTRFEVALRAHSNIVEAARSRNAELDQKGRSLLAGVLQDASFEELCMGGRLE